MRGCDEAAYLLDAASALGGIFEHIRHVSLRYKTEEKAFKTSPKFLKRKKKANNFNPPGIEILFFDRVANFQKPGIKFFWLPKKKKNQSTSSHFPAFLNP